MRAVSGVPPPGAGSTDYSHLTSGLPSTAVQCRIRVGPANECPEGLNPASRPNCLAEICPGAATCPCWQKGLTAASKAPSHSGIRCRKDAWHLHSGIGTDSSRTNGEHGPREASTFLRDFCVGSRTMTRVAGRGSDWPWCVSCRVSGQGQQPVEGERS